MCPDLVLSSCLQIEFDAGVFVPFLDEAVKRTAVAGREFPVLAGRFVPVVVFPQGIAVDLQGFRMLVCPCLDPSFLVFDPSFQDGEIPSFLYGFLPIVLQRSFRVFVLREYYKS